MEIDDEQGLFIENLKGKNILDHINNTSKKIIEANKKWDKLKNPLSKQAKKVYFLL